MAVPFALIGRIRVATAHAAIAARLERVSFDLRVHVVVSWAQIYISRFVEGKY